MSPDSADHVDQIVAQWHRERPDLDTAPLATLGRLFRVAELAEPLLSAPLRELGLRPGWLDLLAALRRAGAPYQLNPTELMRATMLSSGGMTKRLDRLADAGMIERSPDPRDRRGTLVRLTSKGRATIDRAIGLHVQDEARLRDRRAVAQEFDREPDGTRSSRRRSTPSPRLALRLPARRGTVAVAGRLVIRLRRGPRRAPCAHHAVPGCSSDRFRGRSGASGATGRGPAARWP